MQIMEEIYNYQLSDFVAETGGYLGMLVGVSAVTLIDEMAKISAAGPMRYLKQNVFAWKLM